MLKHEDWDHDAEHLVDKEIKLPDNIDSIEVSHDGGRLSIYVNGQKLYYSVTGTRDCTISIDRN